MIELVGSPPEPHEYGELRVAAGRSPRREAGVAASLPTSLFVVTLRDDDRLVGVGLSSATGSTRRSSTSLCIRRTERKIFHAASPTSSWNAQPRYRTQLA